MKGFVACAADSVAAAVFVTILQHHGAIAIDAAMICVPIASRCASKGRVPYVRNLRKVLHSLSVDASRTLPTVLQPV